MKRKCYKSQIFVPRLERALGIKAPAARCHVVDQAGMQKVMRAAGWNRQQSLGVVGFHRKVGGVNQIYVLDNSPWSTLHELIHAFGINSDQLSQFVAEGLTEAIAQENRKGADEHRPTYPTEHEWVTTRLLPMLGMSATELGRVLVRSRNQPRTLAQMVVKANPSLNEGQLRRESEERTRQESEAAKEATVAGYERSLAPLKSALRAAKTELGALGQRERLLCRLAEQQREALNLEVFSVQKELVEVDTALQLRHHSHSHQDHGHSSSRSSEVQQQHQQAHQELPRRLRTLLRRQVRQVSRLPLATRHNQCLHNRNRFCR